MSPSLFGKSGSDRQAGPELQDLRFERIGNAHLLKQVGTDPSGDRK